MLNHYVVRKKLIQYGVLTALQFKKRKQSQNIFLNVGFQYTGMYICMYVYMHLTGIFTLHTLFSEQNKQSPIICIQTSWQIFLSNNHVRSPSNIVIFNRVIKIDLNTSKNV